MPTENERIVPIESEKFDMYAIEDFSKGDKVYIAEKDAWNWNREGRMDPIAGTVATVMGYGDGSKIDIRNMHLETITGYWWVRLALCFEAQANPIINAVTWLNIKEKREYPIWVNNSWKEPCKEE